MKNAVMFALIFAISVSFASAGDSDMNSEGVLTPEIISSIQKSFKMDDQTRAAYNALQSNQIKDFAKDDLVREKLDFIFSTELDVDGITDQASSGRCWLYATHNMHRKAAAEKYNLDKFKFSENYSMFWDKIEKANLFLEYVIMNPKIDTNDREFVLLLKTPLPDGGFFSMSRAVFNKYGVVPFDVMPESESSGSTGSMNKYITRKLRTFAFELRGMYINKKSLPKMRTRKIEMLQEVYKMLVLHLGVPPSEFTWRFVDKDDSIRVVKSTPMDFYKEVYGEVVLDDFIVIGNCPTQPYNKNYQIKVARGQLESADWTFFNLPMDDIKYYAHKLISEGQAVEYSCDVGKQMDSKPGYMAMGIYNFESVYGLDLEFTKEVGILGRESAPNHAMVLIGYDELDGKVVKWKVENSWGDDRGEKGIFLMTDEWFDRYGYSIVIPRAALKDEHKTLIEGKPIQVPFWDPLARIAQVGGYLE